MPNDDLDPIFPGFSSPNYTPVPDEIFDDLLAILSGSELKVLMYIVRRTFGFKRASDTISLSQMLHGIATSDGRTLDRGAGIKDKKTLLEAINKLERKGIILTQRQHSTARGNEPTLYRLHIRAETQPGESPPPLGGKPYQGVGGKTPPSPWGENPAIQETVTQQTDFDLSKFERSHDDMESGNSLSGHNPRFENTGPEAGRGEDGSDSRMVPLGELARLRAAATATIGTHANGNLDPTPVAVAPRQGRPVGTSEERELLAAYLGDFVTQLGDEAPLSSTVTRTLKILKQARVPMSRWPDLLYEAKSITWEHSAQIKKKPSDPSKTASARVRIPYYLAVLESLVGLRPAPTSPEPLQAT